MSWISDVRTEVRGLYLSAGSLRKFAFVGGALLLVGC